MSASDGRPTPGAVTTFVCSHRGRRPEVATSTLGTWSGKPLDEELARIFVLGKAPGEEVEVPHSRAGYAEQHSRDDKSFESATVYWYVGADGPIRIRRRLVWRCPRCRLERRMSIENADKVRALGLERVDVSVLP